MSLIKEITVQELKHYRDKYIPHQLIDVREAYEADIASFNAELIPMGEILNQIDRIKKDVPVVIHCRSGARSAAVIDKLQTQFGFTNLYNLKGGIIAWANEIDNSLTP